MTADTIEDWARAYIASESLAEKIAPSSPPVHFSTEAGAAPIVSGPGRPPELVVTDKSPKTPGPDALRRPEARARLLHTFWHHELQAAELMCWAILRFSHTEPAFRRGLLGIGQDEIRHMSLYADHIHGLGFSIGDFPVRDWFWQRVPKCESEISFVATLGMGFEGANLDHSRVFAERFRHVDDERGAEIQDQVGREEIAHVAFATHWFRKWTGRSDFAHWQAHLVPPVSPLLTRGKTVDRARRLEAGVGADFVDELIRWQPSGS